MHRGDVWVVRMGDQGNAGSPEPRIALGAGDFSAEFGCELAENSRNMDAHLLEYATVHDRHFAAATGRTAMVGAAPWRAQETPRRPLGEGRDCR